MRNRSNEITRPPRILQVHNIYHHAGGEDIVVANENRLLAEHGHEVLQDLSHNDTIRGAYRKLVVAWQAPYSHRSRQHMSQVIGTVRPDIVHVHNFFPLLTPAIYDACQDAGVPVVQTLHNYRTICAGALLMRDGRPCEDCIGRSPYQAVLHGCYRDSRLGSLAVARMIGRHQRKKTWHTKVDRLIALTEFGRQKFIEAGFPGERIRVKPNFVKDPVPQPRNAAGQLRALCVGRLSAEKGIRTLLEAWSTLDVQLNMAGSGPLEDTVRQAGLANINCLGQVAPSAVTHEMQAASVLIFPSECYEGFPMTIVEAFSCGLPVIASRLGSMAEIVEDGVTGLHFVPGDADDLAAKVRWAEAHPEEVQVMGRNARKAFEERYTEGANYRTLLSIYREALEEKAKAAG